MIHNEKILLQRPKNDDYAIIGGHVAAMETSMETLKREFEEELHAEIEVDNLLAIGEIYFPWGKRPCHQICLYYNVHLLDDSIPMDGVFHGYDELDHERINLDFCWIPLEEHNITYTDRHIVEDNPTYEELKEWQSRSGLPLKKFFNTSGLLYKTSAAGHGRNAGKAAVCRGRGSGVDRIPGSRMEGKINLVQGGRI